MKKLIIIILIFFGVCFRGQAQNSDFIITTDQNGPGDINLGDICDVEDIVFRVFIADQYLYCDPSVGKFTYSVRLYKDNVEINRVEKSSGDSDMGCDPISGVPAPLVVNFSLNDILGLQNKDGSYWVRIVVCYTFLWIDCASVEHDVSSQVINVNILDQYHLGYGKDGDNAGSDNENIMTVFAGDELLVVQKNCGIIYKFKQIGSGDNMMAILCREEIEDFPGYDYLIGVQQFGQPIGDVVYTRDNHTLVGLRDGRIAKIAGTGGTGFNMFAIGYTSGGFTSLSGYNYLVGSYDFMAGVTDILNNADFTLISIANGNVLKVNGTAGLGLNFCGIQENSSGFTSLACCNYWVGSQHFTYGHVLNMYATHSNTTFIALSDGKLLHINATGGSGQNMFAVNEFVNSFTNVNLYNYYIGDAYFQEPISVMREAEEFLILGCYNGKILKVSGLGGTGNNMFSITETSYGFIDLPGPWGHPFVGSAMYREYLSAIFQEEGRDLQLGFNDGHFLKIHRTGGTGQDFMNATYVPEGFTISSQSFSNYIIGSSNFNSGVTDIMEYKSREYISFANRKMLQLRGIGFGFNLCHVAQTEEGFRPLCGYDFCTGSQYLCECGGGRSAQELTKNDIGTEVEKLIAINPNPANSMVQATFYLSKAEKVNITIENLTGGGAKRFESNAYFKEGKNNYYFDVSDFANGTYIVFLKLSDGFVISSKLVIIR